MTLRREDPSSIAGILRLDVSNRRIKNNVKRIRNDCYEMMDLIAR